MALPKPSGDFEWVQEPWGAALRCTPLDAIAPHCFSTRDLVLEGVRNDDQTGWENLARALAADCTSLVRMRQVHCADVFEARGKRAHPTTVSTSDDWPEADIAVTRESSFVVTVRTADCVPILLADQRTRAVAAIHAGWKGTAAGAVMVAVDALKWKFGSEPDDLVAAIGPSIGPCCYEVGQDLMPRFAAHPNAPSWFSADSKPRLDLWRATRDQLERAGVPVRQIHSCGLCTFDNPAQFHSYRRDGKAAGRLVAAIKSEPGTRL